MESWCAEQKILYPDGRINGGNGETNGWSYCGEKSEVVDGEVGNVTLDLVKNTLICHLWEVGEEKEDMIFPDEK